MKHYSRVLVKLTQTHDSHSLLSISNIQNILVLQHVLRKTSGIKIPTILTKLPFYKVSDTLSMVAHYKRQLLRR
jgi:hypothetical protein